MLDVKKLLKKAIKRKVRITDALIVTFLITGSLTYAEVTVTNNETIQNSFSETGVVNATEQTVNDQGNGVSIPATVDYSYINNGTISGEGTLTGGDSTYSINPTNGVTNLTNANLNATLIGNGFIINRFFGANVTNNGNISGNISVSGGNSDINYANASSEVASVTSTNVSNNININGSGNGFINNGTNFTLNNNGVIEGNATLQGAKINNIDSTKVINPNTNNTINANVNSNQVGNGVLTQNNSTLNNSGFIKGNGSVIAGSYNSDIEALSYEIGATSPNSSFKFNQTSNINNSFNGMLGINSAISLNNNGFIQGNLSGKGIISNIKLQTKLNPIVSPSGIFLYAHQNTSDISFVNSGNGIFSNIKNFKNNGIISGISSFDGNNVTFNFLNNSEQLSLSSPGFNTNVGFSNALSVNSSSNGVYAQSIDNNTILNNRGEILGKTILTGGKSKFIIKSTLFIPDQTIGLANLTNTALALSNSANGIFSLKDSNINNDGIVSGKSNLTGTNTEMEYTTKSEISNDGILNSNVNSQQSSNAIYAATNLSLNNNGLSQGELSVTGGTAQRTVLISNNRSNPSTVTAQITTTDSGNGISGKISQNGYLNNNGLSQGNFIGNGGVSNLDIKAGAFTDRGSYFISNTMISSNNSGNGVSVGNNNINNNGIAQGNTILTGGKSEINLTELNIQIGNISSGSVIAVNKQINSSINNIASGNGILGNGLVKNTGVISGYTKSTAGTSTITTINEKPTGGKGSTTKMEDYINNSFSGNGIAFTQATTNINNNITTGVSITPAALTSDITNSGLIKGSHGAIAASSITGTVNNYGILAGRQIFSDGTELIENGNTTVTQKNLGSITVTNNNNLGLQVKLASEKINGNTTGNVALDNNGNPIIEKITIGAGGKVTVDGVEKTVVNGTSTGDLSTASGTSTDDLYVNSSKLTGNSNLIINGIGRVTGALTVDSNVSLSNSVINGYETALYVKADKAFNGTDITLNGGGLKSDIAVLEGDSGNNTVELLGNSVINGDTNLGAGDDTLTLANSVQVNGNLSGGDGADNLNLGTPTLTRSTGSLAIYNNISGFENIKTNGDVTLSETAKITGANSIDIQSGNLLLKVDPSATLDGKVIGHALYDNTGTLTSTGGNLVVGLNGLGENGVISMGGTTIAPETNDKYIKTNSLVLDGKLSADGKDITITVIDSIPIPPPVDPEDPNPPVPPPRPTLDPSLYNNLNAVYKSIVSAGEIGALANTTLLDNKTYDEALGGLLTILDQIYANNPYAYSLKSSRDSLKLFEDNLSYLTIKPKENEWIVQGKGFYSGVKNDSSESGKGYYGFDTSHRNYKTTTSFSGGLATAEYGLTNDSSVGFVLGGGHQNTDFKGSSKIKGNTLYLGAFAKKEMNQFRLMSGIGYQYGSLKGERSVSNLYNSFKTDDTYDVNSFNAFVEAKYDYALNNDWTLSPKAKLSWYYVSQDSVNEGYEPGNLSLKVDSAKANTGDLEIGLDLKNTLALNSGTLSNIFSIGVINTLGDKEKDLTGNILGAQRDGSDFNIQGVKLPTTSGKLSYNLEYEKTNGMIYTLGLGYEFAKDNNKNVTGTVGLGYKF